MKAKRLLSLLLTAALMLSMMTPVLAASAETELPRASQTRLEETNEVVSIRLQATGKLVYGSPFELSVVTRPADAQYIGVVLGIKGEAKGYVTLVLSDKLRTLLKMIPLPRKMSKTPDQVEEFNVYAYVKHLALIKKYQHCIMDWRKRYVRSGKLWRSSNIQRQSSCII